ncbi:ABC transporter substrate-binding protein [uncultured Martelella sp.]|uniref:ABC transporter substrate-binding protein n=1 Tax=uncultured Martelella sp. TaxID=392331 RepID=UPI0029C7BB66|nr:ABC transporter substrate-binding protein [uncultured Martelella sp.]
MAATALVSLSAGSVLAEQTEIRFGWWGNEARAANTLKVIEMFEEKYPDITVKAEYSGYNGYQTRLSTQFAGGAEPDISQVLLAWLPLFSKDGDGFYDINDVSDTIDLSQFPQSTLDQVTINGRLQGVPVGSTGFLFVWNKVPWEEAGLDYPETWDELFEDAGLMRERLGEDYYPIDPTIQGSILISLSWAMQKYNVNFVDPNKPEIAMSEEQIADWLSFFKRLEDEHVMVSIKDRIALGGAEKPTTEMSEWVEGKWGGIYSQDATLTSRGDTLPDGLDQLDVGPYVMIPGAETTGMMSRTGFVYSISKNSEHPEAAAKFINYLTTDPDVARVIGVSRAIPASKAQWDVLVSENLIPPIQVEGTDQITELTEAGLVPKFSLYFEHPLMYRLLYDTFEQLSFGKITPEQGAESLMKKGNRILSKL